MRNSFCIDCKAPIVIISNVTKRCGTCQKNRTAQKSKINYTKYRQKNIEKCRERTRHCETIRRNKIRFGGLRFDVLKRDQYTCQHCGKDVSAYRKAVIHHKDRNKQNNILTNLETLCQKCHASHHYFSGHYALDGAPS